MPNDDVDLVAAAAVRERASSSVAISDFKYGVDDFEEWVELLEAAITLATNARGINHAALCKKWLPLKLDHTARAIFKQADKTLQWDALKEELKNLFVDPQDSYEWQANIKTITWDGKENFHALASRIITAVAKYEGDLTEPMKQKRYFFRFREALPKEFQDAIDMGCSATQRTLANAKDLAQRTKMTQSSEDKSVTFAGASMNEDRISGLEITAAKINNRLGNLTTSINSRFDAVDSRFEALDKRVTNIENHLFREGSSSQGLRSSSQSPYGASSSNWAPRSPRGSYQQGSSSRSQSQRFDSNRNFGQRQDSRSQSQSQPNPRFPSTRQGSYSNFQPRNNFNKPRSSADGQKYVKPAPNSQRKDNYRAIETEDELSGPEAEEEEEVGEEEEAEETFEEQMYGFMNDAMTEAMTEAMTKVSLAFKQGKGNCKPTLPTGK